MDWRVHMFNMCMSPIDERVCIWYLKVSTVAECLIYQGCYFCSTVFLAVSSYSSICLTLSKVVRQTDGLDRWLTQFQRTHVAMSNLSLASLSRPQTYTSTSENVFLKIWLGDEAGHQSSHPEVMSESENAMYSLEDACSPSLEPNKVPVGVHVLF